MAALWALTGSMDARPDSRQGLRMADVVHRSGQGEGSEGGAGEGGTEGKGRGRRRRGEGGGGGVARVRVEGRVNGKAFVIEREASSRRSALRFEVEGQDQTCQEIRLTQDRIDALMDTSLLSRTVFFGQHSTAALLEANDADFKAPAPPSPFSPPFPSLPSSPISTALFSPPLVSFPSLPCVLPCLHVLLAELSGVVGMDVWGAARARSKEAVKVLQARVGEMRGGLLARREAVKKLERMVGAGGAGRGGVEEAEGAFNTWEENRAVRQQRVGQQQQGAEQQLASACQRLASLVAPRLQAAVALSHSHALALHSSVLASLSGGEGEGERGTRMGGVGGGRAGRGEEEEGMEERERALMTGIASLQGEVGAREEGVGLSAVTAGLREQQQRLGEFEAHVGGAVGGGEVLVCDRCQQPIDPLHAEECSRQLRAEVEETQRQLAGKQQAQEELRGELGGVRGWLEARRRERRESEERDVQARRQQQQAAMAQQEEVCAGWIGVFLSSNSTTCTTSHEL
ncbi:unnamed protein product [Closterium sp. Naga37s-1]|nr:unnamed protein product [Closterium sp. Naga37s-1]